MRNLFAVMLSILALAGAGARAADAPGAKDHPLFPTRMAGYEIESCRVQDFGVYEFESASGPDTPVEGRFTELTYIFRGDRANEPSGLAVVRNYENAIKSIGGEIVKIDPQRVVTARIVKDGREAWVEVMKGNGKIWLKVVEKGGMVQEVVASAEIFSNDISATGHAAVYGINFDTGSASIKPESADVVAEVTKLLQGDPGLNIFVVGHTDNTGSEELNLRLSQERAQAVTQELIQKHGIAADRLKAFGCGQYAPVASNDTEDGRAKNRRVELVKR